MGPRYNSTQLYMKITSVYDDKLILQVIRKNF